MKNMSVNELEKELRKTKKELEFIRLDREEAIAEQDDESLREMVEDCLAVFEGGEVREDFSTPWVLFHIEELVNQFERIIMHTEMRAETRKDMRAIREYMLEEEE